MKTRYVLLTAAKDEEACIEEVLASIIRQTVRPLAWVIIDDGSSDQTASIIERVAVAHPFIHLQSAGSRQGRNFGSQYKAIMAAYSLAKTLEFDFVGVLDADQAPEREDYHESIFKEFDRNSRLGVASGFVYERPHGVWEHRLDNARTLRQPVQCFEGVASIKSAVTGPSLSGARTGSYSSKQEWRDGKY